MTGTQIILFVFLLLSVLIGCGFAILWLRTRDREIEARRRSEEMAILNAHLDSKSSQLEAKLTKAVGAFNTLRDHAKGKLAEASEAIVYWRDREADVGRGADHLRQQNSEIESRCSQLEAELNKALSEYRTLRDEASKKLAQASRAIAEWKGRYDRLAHWETVQDASEQAELIRAKVRDLERTAEALQNAVEGYGSRYVLPPHSVLDDLAKEAGHKEAGQRLKAARDLSRQMVRKGDAITCDEEDPERRGLIEGFVLDAFNGKIEGIMEGVKSDNIGTLMQEVNDAFLLVNRQSKIFGNAKIQKPYLKARLDELRWASLVQQYKKEERGEQRRIKEQMREEAKIQRELDRERRESERAAKEAAERREEIERFRAEESERLQVAYQKQLEAELARASESERAAVEARMQAEHDRIMQGQRAEYEQRIAEQDERLQEALARGQRALSMAQQVKRGHVYIISNEGSFGEGVYKIGQTRRGAVEDARKQERIDELGDASVPFEFDVHAWLPSDNAPELEHKLQQRFVLNQVNKMNWRKEFFRVPLGDIRRAVEEMEIKVEWTMAAEAREYRETLKLEEQMASDKDFRERWVQEQLGIEPDTSVELEEAEEAK